MILIRYLLVLLAATTLHANDFDNTNLSSRDVAHIGQPYVYENNEVLVVSITTERETLRKLVPEPLIPNSSNTIYFYMGEFNLTQPEALNYLEAGLIIPVSYKSEDTTETGSYFPVLYLDSIDAITSGREVYGYPKFLADITFARTNESIHGIVEIEGQKLIEVKFTINNEVQYPQLAGFNAYTYKRIPSADLSKEYDIRQIISAPQDGITIHAMYLGDATLHLHSIAKNPLGEIPLVNVANAFFRLENMQINKGRVLHDYLKQ